MSGGGGHGGGHGDGDLEEKVKQGVQESAKIQAHLQVEDSTYANALKRAHAAYQKVITLRGAVRDDLLRGDPNHPGSVKDELAKKLRIRATQAYIKELAHALMEYKRVDSAEIKRVLALADKFEGKDSPEFSILDTYINDATGKSIYDIHRNIEEWATDPDEQTTLGDQLHGSWHAEHYKAREKRNNARTSSPLAKIAFDTENTDALKKYLKRKGKGHTPEHLLHALGRKVGGAEYKSVRDAAQMEIFEKLGAKPDDYKQQLDRAA